MRGSRSRRARGLTNESGMPIDWKTKQLVFYECDVETVKRVTLRSGESFTREGANQVFERGYRKRQARAVLFCLTDRMRFQKRNTIGTSPFRKQLTYREIKHFFVFPSHPNVFMLCVLDEENGKKLYEMFRCRPEDVNTICDLTFKASTDPQNLLRDLTPLRQLSISSRDYETEHSGLENNGSPVSSTDELKKADTPYNGTDYSVASVQAGKVDRGLQNGHILDSPPSPDNYRTLSRERSITPPQTKSINFTYPQDPESKIKAVYSCYELVEPKKSLYDRVNHTDFDSPSYNTYHRYPVQTPRSQNQKIQAVPQITISEPSVDYAEPRNLPMRAIKPAEQNGFSPIVPFRPNQQKYPRVVIERETNPGPTVRKSVSTTNLPMGEEITFISYNPVRGTNISENGSVYMYITRYESNRDLTALDGDHQLIHPTISRGYRPGEQQYLDWYD